MIEFDFNRDFLDRSGAVMKDADKMHLFLAAKIDDSPGVRGLTPVRAHEIACELETTGKCTINAGENNGLQEFISMSNLFPVKAQAQLIGVLKERKLVVPENR